MWLPKPGDHAGSPLRRLTMNAQSKTWHEDDLQENGNGDIGLGYNGTSFWLQRHRAIDNQYRHNSDNFSHGFSDSEFSKSRYRSSANKAGGAKRMCPQ